MFLLAPLLIGAIIFYTAVDILAHRKRNQTIDANWEAAAARVQAALDARNRAIGERIGHEVDGG